MLEGLVFGIECHKFRMQGGVAETYDGYLVFCLQASFSNTNYGSSWIENCKIDTAVIHVLGGIWLALLISQWEEVVR